MSKPDDFDNVDPVPPPPLDLSKWRNLPIQLVIGGAIIAAIPPILLAFVQYGWERSIVVLIGYLVIATIMGNIVEPKVMGKRLGLSSLVVWLSLVFWGWIWGTLGMFLSVPLTMVVKILLENSDDLKWAAVLLGSHAETEERLDPSKSTTSGSVS